MISAPTAGDAARHGTGTHQRARRRLRAPAALEAEITTAVDEWMTEGEVAVPGITLTVLLPSGDAVEIARGEGDLVAGTEVTPDDYFRIGSISKTITTVAVLQLVDEGSIDLDATVASYLGDEWMPPFELDGVDYRDAITIRQILSHTDGFPEFAWDPGFYLASSQRLDVPSEPEEILAWAAERGPLYVPGENYEYNTVGHIAAGLVIEKVTGRTAAEVIREGVFDPAGAGEGIYLPPEEAPPSPVVHGYAAGELKAQLGLLPALEQYKAAASEAGDDYYDIAVAPQDFLESVGWTGGGIEAQSAAVARIFRAMFDGTLLSKEMVTEMTTKNPYGNYALGIDVDDDGDTVAYSHGGGVPGFRSHAVYYPDLDIAIAMSVNMVPVDPDVGALADRLLELVSP
ncbi:MAG: serine hydrolase domain-containing protein [Acidimicrobiales bacterium]